MTEHDHEHPDTEHDDEHKKPTAAQLLHWATGDREAEGKALADAAGPEVSDADGEEAVRRAHGDLGDDGGESSSDIATTDDAKAVARES